MALLAELALSLMAAGVAIGGWGSVVLPSLPETPLGWLKIGEKGRHVGRGEGVLWMLCGVCVGGREGGRERWREEELKTQLSALHGCTLSH